MKVLVNEEVYEIKINDTLVKRFTSLLNKKNLNFVYLHQNTNKVHTFFTKTNVDIIGINKKNIIIFKYLNTPKNKIIEVINEKENTDILIFDNNLTKTINVGDTLTFIDENVI